MRIKSRLLLLPLSFPLLLLHTLLTASLHCWELSAIPNDTRGYPTVEIDGKEIVKVVAADCLFIAAALPRSLHCEPAAQAAHGALTLTYGRLGTPRFDMPASIRYKSCEIRLDASVRELPSCSRRPCTRKECAFYLWNSLKAEIERIVHTCPSGCGWGSVPEAEVGLPKTMEGKNSVTVYPAGLLTSILGDDVHVYNV